MPGLVQQHVLVGLHDDEAGVAEMLGEPVSGDETLGMRVLLQRGVLVGCDGHGRPPAAGPLKLGPVRGVGAGRTSGSGERRTVTPPSWPLGSSGDTAGR